MQTLTWKKLSAAQRTAALRRPAQSAQPAIAAAVRVIVSLVRRTGDRGLRQLTKRFDRADVRSLRVSEAEFAEAGQALSREDLAALRRAYGNIRKFHAAQRTAPVKVETTPGIVCEK